MKCKHGHLQIQIINKVRKIFQINHKEFNFKFNLIIYLTTSKLIHEVVLLESNVLSSCKRPLTNAYNF